MKTRSASIVQVLIVAAAIAGSPLWGQTLTLVNGTDGHVLAGTIPVSTAEYQRYKANPGLLKSLVLQEYSNLRDIAPGSFITDVPVFQNDTLVFGIVNYPGRDGAVVFDFRVPRGGGSANAGSGSANSGATASTTASTTAAGSANSSPATLPASRPMAYLVSESVLTPAASGSAYLAFSSFELPGNTRPVRIDRRFVDWLSIADLRRYSQRYNPLVVVQRTAESAQQIDIGESSLWEHGGSRIERVKMLITGGKLNIMVSSFGSVSRGVRYVFRYFDGGSAPGTNGASVSGQLGATTNSTTGATGTNAATSGSGALAGSGTNTTASPTNIFTLEIPVLGIGGPVYLWVAGQAEPLVVGQYAAANFSVEAEIDMKKVLDSTGLRAWAKGAELELSSAVAEPGIHEEFFYGQIPFAEIPELHE